MYKYIILKKKEIERPRKDRASVILSSTMKLLGILYLPHTMWRCTSYFYFSNKFLGFLIHV